jgi:tRNA A-37 threonylcarbamoyl transferase component Bud32
MPAPRAPWWLYLIAASLLCSFTLATYNFIWGPQPLGLHSDISDGSMIVSTVTPQGAAAHAGLRTGDRIVAVDGIPIRRGKRNFDFHYRVEANFESGRPIPIEVERQGVPVELTANLRRGTLKDLALLEWEMIGGAMFTFILALLIALRRPHDPVALIAALFMVGMAFNSCIDAVGWASFWRHLPGALGLLLWPALIPLFLTMAFAATFAAIFPRKLFHNRWIWALIWMPLTFFAAVPCFQFWRLVYQPNRAPTALDLIDIYLVWNVLALCYVPATLLVLGVQYRRLEDVNERRRMRVLFAGLILCGLGFCALVFLVQFLPARLTNAVYVALWALYLTGPASLAYAVLRHRVFDVGVMLRRGLQYALARRLLVSAVPVLAVAFLADLFLHGDQPILSVFRARGWMYAALAVLATIAYTRRQNWLDKLDRRFFREHYDARRLLREVVEEIHLARNFDQEAPRVVTRIEAALHPEFVAILVRELRETSYRTHASAPAGKSPPPLNKDSKLIALMRLLGKPLEVPQTESGWLQQQLPHEETDFLRQARIDLLVPVPTDEQCTEAILALGSKRSEEPYSGEDQDLLVTIAASLAILLEKPAVVVAPRTDIFEECPQCGTCYDSGLTRCTQEGARLVPVILPRLLQERYRLERRLGRGGMGTVYAASDISLERRVAVKVIRENLVGSTEAAERFRREARAAASFTHPNVVTVYDFGVAAGTRAFLVMEILEGSTLRERLRLQKRFAPAGLVSVLDEVGAALGAAHRRQLVHRDIKPENIFLVTRESDEIAKVLDFGLAKFVSNSTEQPTADTAPGAVLGTVRYMSPEQRRGEAAHHAWDLWALAVVTYEMLTGAYPFEDNSLGDWSAGGGTARFTPVTKYLPGAGRGWQQLFEHSFAHEPSDRHDSADAFLCDLHKLSSQTAFVIATGM